jgi:hypothetical protein
VTAPSGEPLRYRVAAVTAAGASATTAEPIVRTGEVTGLHTEESDGEVRFSWTAPPNAMAVEVWRRPGDPPEARYVGRLVPGATLMSFDRQAR